MKRLVLTAALSATLFAGTSSFRPEVAQAQVVFDQVEPGFKGVIGLGIVGAELGFVLPAVAGLHETWAFIVFPIVGAAGGAIGGYFAFEQPGNVELSVTALAVGMALIIPSMVITLAATAYDPEDEGELVDGEAVDADAGGEIDTGEDGEFGVEGGAGGSVGAPPATEPAPAETAPPPGASLSRDRALRVARAGSGMFRWSDDTGLMLGVPGLAFAPVDGDTEVHVPLLTGAF